MFRRFALGFTALSIAASAAAAGIGPPIAFLKTGGRTGNEVYLVNPDGTGLRKLHVAQGIEQIALRPGGGELALSFGGNLRFITFDDRGVATGTRDIKGTILVGRLSYRADGTLLYSLASGPQQVRTVAPGASSSTLLFTVAGNISGLSWLRDGAGVIFTHDNVIKVRDAAGVISTLGPTAHFPAFFEVAQTADRAIVADWTSATALDLATGARSATCKPMSMVSYSPGDTEMVYRAPAGPYNQTYLFVQKSDCSGSPFRLGTRGGYRGVDWRP